MYIVSERVLVIDFDRRECQRLGQELRDRGYDVSTATSGAEVRERLSQGLPGLVLLDPMLPGEDGFKLCRELKRPDRADPPKIVVASRIYKGQRYRTMAERAGADVFLERPAQEQQVLPTVERLLPVAVRPASEEPLAADPPELIVDAGQPQEDGEPTQAQPEPVPTPPSASPQQTAQTGQATAAPTGGAPRRVATATTPEGRPSSAASESAASAPSASAAKGAPPPRSDAGEGGQPSGPEDVPGFSAVTDDDIDNALAKALGESGPDTGGTSAQASDAAADPPPATVVNTAPQGVRPTPGEAAAAQAPARPHGEGDGEGEDDLSNALDDLGIEVASPEARGSSGPQGTRRPAQAEPARQAPASSAVSVLDSPLSFEPTEDPGAGIERRGEEAEPGELELQTAQTTGAHASPQTPGRAAPEPAVAGSADESRQPTGSASSEPEAEAPADELDSMLDRAFAGTGPDPAPADPSPDAREPAADTQGPPPFTPPQPSPPQPGVPDSLRGMDEGTADLLSSLEELDSSLPTGAEGSEATGWTGSGLTEDVPVGESEPRQPEAPTPEEEASLDDVVEQLTGSSELSGTGEREPSSADAIPEPGVAAGEPADHREAGLAEEPAGQEAEPPRRKRWIRLGWLFSFFVGLLAVGTSGALLWIGGPDDPSPSSTELARALPGADSGAGPGTGIPGEARQADGVWDRGAGTASGAEERTMRRIPEDAGEAPEPAEANPASGDPVPATQGDDAKATGATAAPESGSEEDGTNRNLAAARPRPDPRSASLTSAPQAELPREARSAAAAERSDTGGDRPSASAGASGSPDGGIDDGSNAMAAAAKADSNRNTGRSGGTDDRRDGSGTRLPATDNASSPNDGASRPTASRTEPAESSTASPPHQGEDTPADAGSRQPAHADSDREEPPPETTQRPIPIVGLRDLDQPLELLASPTPKLAPEAEEKGISGRVFVNLLIGPDGTVRDVRVMIDPGYGLGQAARQAASDWRYTKPRSRARPVRVWKTEVVEFETAAASSAKAD